MPQVLEHCDLPRAEPCNIDLSRYQTRDLVEQITELISVPRILRRTAVTSFLIALATLLTCIAFFFDAPLSKLMWMLVCGYAVVLGFVFGVVLAGIRIIAGALNNVETILGLALKVTDQAVTDFEQLHSGDVRIPSAGDLVAQVYDDVIMPAIEKAAEGAFSFLGTGLVWVYRTTMGAAIRYVIESMRPGSNASENESSVQTQITSALSSVASNSDQLRTYLAVARNTVGTVTARLRCYAILPLHVLYVLSFLGAACPLYLVWWFGVGDASSLSP